MKPWTEKITYQVSQNLHCVIDAKLTKYELAPKSTIHSGANIVLNKVSARIMIILPFCFAHRMHQCYQS